MRIEWQEKAKVELQIDKQIKLLAVFPFIGKIEPLLLGRLYEYRSWVIHEHFKLIYHINDGVIYIANIWDTRREPQRLTEEVY